MLTTNTAVTTAAVMKHVDERCSKSHGLFGSMLAASDKPLSRSQMVLIDILMVDDAYYPSTELCVCGFGR